MSILDPWRRFDGVAVSLSTPMILTILRLLFIETHRSILAAQSLVTIREREPRIVDILFS